MWQDVIGFRNVAVHAYFTVDWSIVWTTATRDVPDLQRVVERILAQEYGEGSSTAPSPSRG